MKAVGIDFAGNHRRIGLLTAMIAGIGIISLFITTHFLLRLEQTRRHLQSQLDTLQAAGQTAQSASLSLTPEQINATNQAIDTLNLPWGALFDTLGKAPYKHAALLTLTPDPTQKTVQINAETASAPEMIRFVQNLQREPMFVQVILGHHEINEQDPNRPFRFSVQADWSVR